MATGSEASVKGDPLAPAYTPPAEEAKKIPRRPFSSGCHWARKSSSTATSASSSASLVPTTPLPAHHHSCQSPVSARASSSSAATAASWSVHGTRRVRTARPRVCRRRLTALPRSPEPPTTQLLLAATKGSVRGVLGDQVERLAHRHVDRDADVLSDHAEREQHRPRADQHHDGQRGPALHGHGVGQLPEDQEHSEQSAQQCEGD